MGRQSLNYVLSPFTVVRDTREQHPFAFQGFKADSRHKGKDLVISLVDATLPTGDYSIQGVEAEVCVERKSLNDLFGTLLGGRERFERELQRMAAMRWCAVVVEASWHDVLEGYQTARVAMEAGSDPSLAKPNEFDGATVAAANLLANPRRAKTVYRSVIAYQQRYPNVHWWFCGSRALAERTTYRVLERYWIDRGRLVDEVAAATST